MCVHKTIILQIEIQTVCHACLFQLLLKSRRREQYTKALYKVLKKCCGRSSGSNPDVGN